MHHLFYILFQYSGCGCNIASTFGCFEHDENVGGGGGWGGGDINLHTFYLFIRENPRFGTVAG